MLAIFAIIALVLCAADFRSLPPAPSSPGATDTVLTDGWRLSSARTVTAGGAAVSAAGYHDSTWVPVRRMPGTVLGILQEAVTNAVRHGRAHALWVSAASDDSTVTLSLRDDGGGFDAAASHGGRGLKNMRYRAAEVGAALRLDSGPGRGATVVLSLRLG